MTQFEPTVLCLYIQKRGLRLGSTMPLKLFWDLCFYFLGLYFKLVSLVLRLEPLILDSVKLLQFLRFNTNELWLVEVFSIDSSSYFISSNSLLDMRQQVDSGSNGFYASTFILVSSRYFCSQSSL